MSRLLPTALVRVVLLAVLVALAAAPWAFGGALDTAVRLCVLIVLAGSLDLVMARARRVSFLPAAFFALGAWGVALAARHMDGGAGALVAGMAAAAAVAGLSALVIGLVALRGPAIRFAMVTFVAAAGVASVGPGLSVGMPPALQADAAPAALAAVAPGPIVLGGLRLDGDIARYYVVFAGALLLVAVMQWLVGPPSGRRAHRSDDIDGPACPPRHALGITVVAAIAAALAGGLHAIWTGTVRLDATVGIDLTIALFAITVVGGMGTRHGAVIGAAALVAAERWLPDLVALVPPGIADLPGVAALLAPDRATLWLGVLVVIGALCLPNGPSPRHDTRRE